MSLNNEILKALFGTVPNPPPVVVVHDPERFVDEICDGMQKNGVELSSHSEQEWREALAGHLGLEPDDDSLTDHLETIASWGFTDDIDPEET